MDDESNGRQEQQGQLWWLWQRRAPRERSQQIGVILGGLTGAIWFRQTKHLAKIVQVLRELLPAELADHLAVEGLRRNTLHLRVDSAAHRYELEMIKEPLLDAINQQVSGVFVRDIKLSLGRLEDPWPAPRRAGGSQTMVD